MTGHVIPIHLATRTTTFASVEMDSMENDAKAILAPMDLVRIMAPVIRPLAHLPAPASRNSKGNCVKLRIPVLKIHAKMKANAT